MRFLHLKTTLRNYCYYLVSGVVAADRQSNRLRGP